MRISLLLFGFIGILLACQKSANEELKRDRKPAPVEIGDYPERGEGFNEREELINGKGLNKDSTRLIYKKDSLENEQEMGNARIPVKQKPNESEGAKKSTKLSIIKKKVSEIFFDEPVYDFDTITEGDIIEHGFTFKNKGDRELNLLKVVPGCGCTLPTYPFIGIAPGEENVIKVRYNSVSKQGPQKSVITVYSDDPLHGQYEISLVGYVQKKIKD